MGCATPVPLPESNVSPLFSQGLWWSWRSLLPAIVYPDGRMPMSTALDRAFVYVFSWCAVVALASPPATLLAIGLAIWLARSAGWRSHLTRGVAAVVLLAI